jgi:type VI secretion system protein ImpJ
MEPRKPVWTEGLFVTQHHFQQLDRYHEQLLDERFRAVMPLSWGIQAIEIDERALASGQLKLRELTAILPDGTPVRCSDSDGDAPPPRNIEGLFPPHLERLPVSIGIAHAKENGPNVIPEATGMHAVRFHEHTMRTTDFNLGSNEQDIAWARPVLRILVGDEAREAFDAVQVTELSRNATGGIVACDNYVPPVLQIRAAPFLMDRFRRILSAMTSRQRSLMRSRKQRTAAAIEFQASDAAKFWLLDSLNESIPVMAHLADHGTTHPEQAYLSLAQLIGRLCTLAVDGDPTTIPKFNYLRLGDTFEPMFARALTLIDAVIAERYTEIPLQRRDDGMHLGQIQDASLLRQDWFLAASGGTSEADLRDRLPKLSKVASWNQIGPLLNSALNGLRLELEYRPPGALPIKPGVVFFRVQRTTDFWPDIQGTGSVALYHPLGNNIELSLYAVDPQSL